MAGACVRETKACITCMCSRNEGIDRPPKTGEDCRRGGRVVTSVVQSKAGAERRSLAYEGSSGRDAMRCPRSVTCAPEVCWGQNLLGSVTLRKQGYCGQ